MIRCIASGVSAMALLFALAGAASAADAPAPAKKVSAVVITGGHGYEQKPFLAVFDAMDGVTYKHVDEKVGGEAFENIDDWKYDVIVLYNFNRKISDKQAENFVKLLDKGVGLVILHHAIAAYQNWPEYRKILGARYYLKDETDAAGVTHKRCAYKHDVDMKVHVEDPKCP
ncbi:MAG: hypothetical protein NTY65_17430, partial [Planctomycetota bacterium]|nr:hypothetical protein [Planctomycetota bacterium]